MGERELVLELFFGRPNLQGKRPRIYPSGEGERAARKALARFLREGKLDQDLAEALAALIDPDADLKTQPLRILKFQFRGKEHTARPQEPPRHPVPYGGRRLCARPQRRRRRWPLEGRRQAAGGLRQSRAILARQDRRRASAWSVRSVKSVKILLC